eukprot:9143513-Prorocentrum_lima.AAC.1
MTSSLVGSEMCIRDRHDDDGQHGCRRLSGSSARPTARSRSPALLSIGPVSYTHLTLPTICSV